MSAPDLSPITLGSPTNKTVPSETEETQIGIVGPLLPELLVSESDEEILDTVNKFKKAWDTFLPTVQRKWQWTERYYLGNQFMDGVDAAQFDSLEYRPLVDNIIFESLETLIPLVTRKNPEPVVDADKSEIGVKLAKDTQQILAYLADFLTLKLHLKQVVRMWSIYFLGCLKIGWDYKTKEMAISVVRTPKLILDPRATIVDGCYTGSRIGEYRDDSASDLIIRFPDHKKFITDYVKGDMATEINYIEWWTPDYVCWQLGTELLGKSKNPHWNYEETTDQVDAYGQVDQKVNPGKNHFPTRQMPYMFLSVFNVGKHPIDDTSLIYQNLAMQDVVNKRIRQEDRNNDQVNGGWVISLNKSGLTKEQASGFVDAMRNGGAATVPDDASDSAIARKQGLPLPPQVTEQKYDARDEIRNSMGVRGSTPQGTTDEKTVRGKIITQQQDGDRASFVAEYLEQLADQWFNWAVQMMYVYYDVPHAAAILGEGKTQEYVELSKASFVTKLSVSVKEGSLIPTDPLTIRNQAMDLWNAQGIDPISLYAALDFPNPRESAKTLFLWQNAPAMLFQDDPQVQQFQAQQQAAIQNAQGPPGATPNPELVPGGGDAPQQQSQDLLQQVPIG